jgi:hypothetical protein
MAMDGLRKNLDSIIHHTRLLNRDAKINIKSWVHYKFAWLVFWSYTDDVWYYLSIFYTTLVWLPCYWAFTLHYVHTEYVWALQIQVWLVPSLKRYAVIMQSSAKGECFWMNYCFPLLQSLHLSSHPARQLYHTESLHMSGQTLTAAVLQTTINETLSK